MKELHDETCLDVARASDYVDTGSPTEIPHDPVHTLEYEFQIVESSAINLTSLSFERSIVIKEGHLHTPADEWQAILEPVATAGALLGTFYPRKRSNTSPPTYSTSLPGETKIETPQSFVQLFLA
jgi:hypothetical protein